MEKLLFLAHRIPYPPNKGDKIRSWNILQYLARKFEIHLGCFVDNPEDVRYRGKLEEICASCHFARLNPPIAKILSLRGLFSGAPLTLGYFWDNGLARWVAKTFQSNDITNSYVFSSSMAQYVLQGDAAKSHRVVDFVDVDSDKWHQYAQSKSSLMSSVYSRESRLLLEFERKVATKTDVSLFVSDSEAAMFRKLAPESGGKIRGMNNGVDLSYFDPTLRYGAPYDLSKNNVVFTGAMDYWANVDAVCWFAKDVLPTILVENPDTHFWIVGANPAREVLALRDCQNVHVTGQVPDVRPYISHADAIVAPLRLARGIQNKVLEAMAMARPIVATPEALEGIDATIGHNVLCESKALALAGAVLSLSDRASAKELGDRGREFVSSGYSWDTSLKCLDTILRFETPP